MSLKFMLKNLEGLEEATAALYVKHDDGKFYLDVDGVVSKTRLDEFRNNNVDLLKKLEAFDDVDATKYAELIKKEEAFNNIDGDTAEKVKLQVAEQVKAMQSDFDGKNKTSSDKIDVLNRQLEGLLIDSAVRKESNTGEVLATAVDDVLLRAKSVFKVVEGVATPHDSAGNVIYGKNGADPMTIGEWMTGLSKDATHLFKQSTGGGAPGGNGKGGHNQDTSKMSPLQKIQHGIAEDA